MPQLNSSVPGIARAFAAARDKTVMSNQNKWFSNPTQVFWTCEALIEGRTISHKTEIREVRGWRLGAIIHRLKHEYAWPILVEYRGPENVAYYRLSPDCDRTKLRFPPSARALSEDAA
ncbi:hypothetical protein [Tropicibacter oceani]|uniref:Uncharacterized protein n=1 Tax=Tropicibacter oceani TaxID=3058420 RepID=A0ABY8QE57_9RHOB|nr:hypothetical protein [Tropicibacter oceani]WGW02326.1 hypothetical protein QF118_10215 [Tropicibacter oceani]